MVMPLCPHCQEFHTLLVDCPNAPPRATRVEPSTAEQNPERAEPLPVRVKMPEQPQSPPPPTNRLTLSTEAEVIVEALLRLRTELQEIRGELDRQWRARSIQPSPKSSAPPPTAPSSTAGSRECSKSSNGRHRWGMLDRPGNPAICLACGSFSPALLKAELEDEKLQREFEERLERALTRRREAGQGWVG